ncbi:type IX secretion system membrane protein, PorP/SprF family [Arenibacter nanhaiticus]|uniref:Type IX secretion system membrane protein, PorP/SprF family n=1 Tax=Arenibacter nanhaiticus TaxID=558155 RepID=A0A1M6HT70_9FLAO|nr:type IX secretion system membrane protein PorP/SprF [Arenibacter nanhaiticus]SHJ25399.1 type IX secretion system membrane protein, PorP/SprF family [Arenibacter nanhaiticus]
MRHQRRSLLLVLLLCTAFSGLYAQQDAQFTQYMFNTMSINPAYAGSRGQLSIAGLYRSQWVGVEGAPKTQTLNLHAPIRDSKLGYGISIVNDEIGNGVVQETYLDAMVSYTIEVSLEGKLSFGLKASANILNLDFNGLKNYESENVQGDNIDNKVSPNFGVGLYYHTDKFYAGLSAPNLIETKHFDNSQRNAKDTQFLAAERINFYMITGYVFDLERGFKFKPALLTKVVGGAPLQVDVSANFLYNEKFSFGAAYRWDAAVSGMVGFQISDQFTIGLAYDRETTALGNTQFNDGSFEVFLRFEVEKSVRRMRSRRFF